MEKFVVNGGNKLIGELDVQTAKNAVLPILAASVLADDKVTILNAPDIIDVKNMCKILSVLGCNVEFNNKDIVIDATTMSNYQIPSGLAHELRSSVFLLGSIISRFKKAKIAYPGGCDIGLRPVDLHLNGLKRLGVDIEERDGYIECKCDKLIGNEVMLDCPSVGATENIMLAGVCAEGTTVIRNAAREPEIEDLQNFLNRIGAKVAGAGSSVICIEGVKKLAGTCYKPIADRIEAGTFLVATAMCKGEIKLNGLDGEMLSSILHKLNECGLKVLIGKDYLYLKCDSRLHSIKWVETQPYPGFPTDMQAQIATLCCVTKGQSIITENLFETRYKYVPELKKMGADIIVSGRNAIIKGIKRLRGTRVLTQDLRGGAALTLAALQAEGESEVLNISLIDRGYEEFEYKLTALGARIKRVYI